MKNADALIDILGLEGAGVVSGGTNDNASDAQHEIPCSVNLIREQCVASTDEQIQKLAQVNGVT